FLLRHLHEYPGGQPRIEVGLAYALPVRLEMAAGTPSGDVRETQGAQLRGEGFFQAPWAGSEDRMHLGAAMRPLPARSGSPCRFPAPLPLELGHLACARSGARTLVRLSLAGRGSGQA